MGDKEQRYNQKQIDDGKLLPSWVDVLLEHGVRTFQFEQQLTVDGLAGPATQARLKLLDAPVPPLVGTGIGYYPMGKGVYIRTLKHCGTPAQAVETAQRVGLSFVVIGSVWVDRRVLRGGMVSAKRFNSVADLAAYGKAFREAGIEVWVWGYPYPEFEREFVDTMIADALTSGAVGLILDPEKPYRKKHSYADILMQMLKPELEFHTLAIGVTSYGSVWSFKDFPYSAFAQIKGTFGSPQIYDGNNNMPASYAHRSFDAYQEAGYQTIVMSAPGYKKTTFQWNRLVSLYPVGIQAIIVWDWSNLRLGRNKHLWDTIRDYAGV